MGRSNDDRWKKHVLSKLHAPDDDIRSEAIVAAGELELTSARAALLDLLDDEEDEEIRGGFRVVPLQGSAEKEFGINWKS